MYAIFYLIVLEFSFQESACYNRARANILDYNELENNVKMIMKPMKKLFGIFPNHNIEVQFDIEQQHTAGPDGNIKLQKQAQLHNSAYLYHPARTFFRSLDFTENKPSTPFSYRAATDFHKDLPIQGNRRSNDLTSNTTSTMETVTASSSTIDPDKQIVYMKDFKRALDDLEKKLMMRRLNGLTSITTSTMETVTTPSSTIDPDKQIVYMKDFKRALDDLEKKLMMNNCNPQESRNMTPLSSKISLENPTLMNILNTFKNNGPLEKAIPKPSDEDLSWLKIKLPV